MELVKIKIEGFKNFDQAASLHLDQLAPGLHLVRGRNLVNERLGANGAGKTTFFSDAPTWCLFGRTVGGLRTGECQTWLSDKPPIVSVTMRHNDDVEYLITRGPKATQLEINGRAVGQEDVDALIGLSYDAWGQAIIFGQGQPLFFDLTAANKMDLLATALNLERW